MSVSYPSGLKTVVIMNEAYKTICKAFVRGTNINRIILETISRESPVEIVNRTAQIVKEESHAICKRGSQTLLRKKDYEDFFTFTWEQLNNELKCSCPMLAAVMESVVWDIPQSVSSKAFRHIMLATALGLHGRSQEMSAIQYMIGFVLTQGGCTQRVSLKYKCHLNRRRSEELGVYILV